MNRLDYLTDRLLDGTLTDEEAVELEKLLAADPSARSRHLAAVRLELVLRGLRSEFVFTKPTIAKLETDRVERVISSVMAKITCQPFSGRPTSRLTRRVALAALGITVLSLLLIMVWVKVSIQSPSHKPADPVRAFSAPARLITVSGTVQIAGNTASTAQANQLLSEGQTILTVGDESVAVVQFPDGSQLQIYPGSTLQLTSVPNPGNKKLTLFEGRVTAFATGELTIVSENVEVETHGGSFSVCCAGSASVRVESVEGQVRIRSNLRKETIALNPGQAAFVCNDAGLVRLDDRWQVSTEPLARLDFPALDVAFAPDGEVWAVSAKQWTRWKPGAPDPGRTLFLPKVFNDGLAAWFTPDRQAVVLCRMDDREECITIRDMPSGAERGRIPVRVSEPRFVCISPDASWVATITGARSGNRWVQVWDATSGNLRFQVDVGNPGTCLASSPNGRWLAVGVSDLARVRGNRVAIFDLASGQQVLNVPTNRKGVYSLAFSLDSNQLAVGFNGAIQLWDLPSCRLVHSLEGFERGVTRLAFSPSGQHLAAGTHDGQVWIWSTATGQYIQVISTGTFGVRSLGFSADGKLLVTATNKAPVAVWEVVSEQVQIPGHDF